MKPVTIAAGAALAVLSTTVTSFAQPRGPQNDPARSQREAEERAKADEGRLRGAALAGELQGVEIADGLPDVLFYPALEIHFPYQTTGLGATVVLLPWQWLRLSAHYAFGITPNQGSIAWTNYGETLLGVRVFGASGETAVDVPLKPRGAGFFPNVPVVKAWVPSHHALFVEGGAFTGFTSLQLCGDDCDPDVAEDFETTQLVMPLGGIRYVYGFDLKSKRRNARARFLLEIYAHVLGPPFNAPEGKRYFPNNSSAGEPGFGGRVGIRTSPFGACIAAVVFGFGCLDGGFGLGYASYPRAPIFEMQIGGFVY